VVMEAMLNQRRVLMSLMMNHNVYSNCLALLFFFFFFSFIVVSVCSLLMVAKSSRLNVCDHRDTHRETVIETVIETVTETEENNSINKP